MKNRVFDEQVRRKVQQESWIPTLQSRKRLMQAVQAGRTAEHPNCWKRYAAAACAAVLAAVLLVLMIQPPLDERKTEASQTDAAFVMADGQPLETPVPVTEPEVHFSTQATERWMSATAVFTNHTEDIWLLTWNALPPLEHKDYQQAQKPTPYIWLEPGASYADSASVFWQGNESRQSVEVLCSCSAYRVTADLLFWQDGPLQDAHGEDYADQQALLEDAFASGALMLYAQEWQAGTAGGVELLIPDRAREANPDALQYYIASGALTLGAETHEMQEVAFAYGFDADSFFGAKEADVRLAVSEFSDSHAMFIVDFVAPDVESLKELQPLMNEVDPGAEYTFSGWINPQGGNDPAFWQDQQGYWHRTWQAGVMDHRGISGRTFTLSFSGFEPMGGTVRLEVKSPSFLNGPLI